MSCLEASFADNDWSSDSRSAHIEISEQVIFCGLAPEQIGYSYIWSYVYMPIWYHGCTSICILYYGRSCILHVSKYSTWSWYQTMNDWKMLFPWSWRRFFHLHFICCTEIGRLMHWAIYNKSFCWWPWSNTFLLCSSLDSHRMFVLANNHLSFSFSINGIFWPSADSLNRSCRRIRLFLTVQSPFLVVCWFSRVLLSCALLFQVRLAVPRSCAFLVYLLNLLYHLFHISWPSYRSVHNSRHTARQYLYNHDHDRCSIWRFQVFSLLTFKASAI